MNTATAIDTATAPIVLDWTCPNCGGDMTEETLESISTALAEALGPNELVETDIDGGKWIYVNCCGHMQ